MIVTVGFWILSIDKIDVVNMVLIMKQLFPEYHLEPNTLCLDMRVIFALRKFCFRLLRLGKH